MNMMKKFVAAATLLIMLATSGGSIEAQEYVDTGGSGYYSSSTVPSLTTEIALGTVAVIAIVAIAIRHGHHGHSAHGHSH
jgi:hypothetical protein